MTVVIVVPVLRRPHRVVPLVESIEENTLAPHRILFVCTPDDTDEIAAVDKVGVERINTDRPYKHGDYAHKINLGYLATWEEFLFLGADDLQFHPDWLEHALTYMTDGVGVVGTNDLGNQRVMSGQHATHSLVARAYVDKYGTIDEPHKVLHDGYWHNFVDDELVKTAQARNRFAFAPDSHVEHLHPNWGKSEHDPVYAHGMSGFDIDRRRFQKRRHLWE